MSRRKRVQAFTLIELLVTLAVVIVLMGILVPTISSVRQRSVQAKSISNLGMITKSALIYFNDRGGELFPTKYWEQYPSWGPSGKQGMRDYLGFESPNVAISNDPTFFRETILTVSAMREAYPEAVERSPLYRCYGYNYYLNARDPSSSYNNVPSADRPYLASGPVTVANIEMPSRMWMFTEGALSADKSFIGTSIQDARSEPSMLFSYAGKQNFSFVDGHIESLTREEFLERAEQRLFWGRRE